MSAQSLTLELEAEAEQQQLVPKPVVSTSLIVVACSKISFNTVNA